MNIIAIKTNVGYYCSNNEYNEYKQILLLPYYFNGKQPERTFHPKWVLIKDKPEKIEIEKSQPCINYRYELKDPSMGSDLIPAMFAREDVAEYIDYEWVWFDKYRHLYSLYDLKFDKQPNILEPVEFSFNVIFEVDGIKEHEDFSYTVQKTQWSHEGTKEITNKNAKSQIFDQVLFPDIMLPDKPCSLTSKETYDIIREHIKMNIDPKYAEVTSDYDFCFTVKKKIPLAEPVKYTVDVNNSLFSNRKRKPKYVDRYKKERFVEVFEMTHTERNYTGYTPVTGFRGKNHTDLKGKIDFYLENLMEVINKPLIDCECCKGLGVKIE